MRNFSTAIFLLASSTGCRPAIGPAESIEGSEAGTLANIRAAAPTTSENIVVISDIDDTIKRSHILGETAGIATAFTRDIAFSGMAELYRQISNKYVAMGKTVSFFYVSNAPEMLMLGSHERFIEAGGFPEGEFKLADFREKNHKERIIKAIIKEKSPKTVFYFGDNGERDVFVYAKVEALISDSRSYIRMAYRIKPDATKEDAAGKPLKGNQIGFISAGEIAIDLFKKGKLDLEAVKNVVHATLHPPFLEDPDILSYLEVGYDKVSNLSYWVDCRDHRNKALPPELSRIKEVVKHNQIYALRCKKKPKEKLDVYTKF